MAIDVVQMFVDSLDDEVIDSLTNDEMKMVNDILDKLGY
jgi:hypothetical protein